MTHPLSRVVARLPGVAWWRDILAIRLGVRRSTPTGVWALSVAALAHAEHCRLMMRDDPGQQHLGRLLPTVLDAVAVVTGAVRPPSAAALYTARDRVICCETALYVVLGVPWLIRAAARGYYGLTRDEDCGPLATCVAMPHDLGGARWTTSRHPINTVRRRMRSVAREMPQDRMMPILDTDIAAPVMPTAGIDARKFVQRLRATGDLRDADLAATIERHADGITKRAIGGRAYQRMLRFLGTPRARSIARQCRQYFTRAAKDGVMAQPDWYYTVGRRPDSVWHAANARLLR
jgi:hypothetical protein